MNKKLLGIPLAIGFCLLGTLHATTVERLDLEGLVKKSNKIVIGKVVDSRTNWGGASGRLILTTYTLEVEESIKGQRSSTLELTTVGGKIGNLQLHVSGMVSFDKGENAVVFVENSGAYSTVVGLGQGKFTI